MTTSPVSSSDFRLEMQSGQATDIALMSSDSGRSISWMIVSFTARPSGSSAIVQRLGPSALSSDFHSFCQRITIRCGGSISNIAPVSAMRPSGRSIFHEDPIVQLLSQRMPNQYCFMNSKSVSADHNISGVVRM